MRYVLRSLQTRFWAEFLYCKVLSISHGEFYWTKDAASPTLDDINLTVKKGELVGILGRVGAGKVNGGANFSL